MQNLKSRFKDPDGGRLSTLQTCIRTNDIDVVGDGTHLTSFGMMGNFSFGNGDYVDSVKLWDGIVRELELPVTTVHVHPTRFDHAGLWRGLGYAVVLDPSCEWTDGEIGGHCCELYCGDLEIGNLVNTLEYSTDVGFGWERIIQIVEGKRRVDQTSLFRQDVHPVVADHLRTLQVLLDNGIRPGNKGREYICRRLLRRVLRFPLPADLGPLTTWVAEEHAQRERRLEKGRKLLRRHGDKDNQWWWESCGILPEERELL
jgi:hypothetical protein